MVLPRLGGSGPRAAGGPDAGGGRFFVHDPDGRRNVSLGRQANVVDPADGGVPGGNRKHNDHCSENPAVEGKAEQCLRRAKQRNAFGPLHDADFRIDAKRFGHRFANMQRPPGAAALGRAQVRMPGDRRAAEARLETLEEWLGERDLREQDERLAVLAQRLGDRLEIDLGLARSGDAVEQRDWPTLTTILSPRVSLSMFGRTTSVELDFAQVEKA